MKRIISLFLCVLIVITGVGAKSSRHTTDGSKKVYVTESGTKYHKKSCRYAKHAYKITLEDAVDEGYKPCKKCKPPILDTDDDDDTGFYVLNTSTKKFHYQWCRDVSRISRKNYKETDKSRSSLIKSGYSPCGHCNP